MAKSKQDQSLAETDGGVQGLVSLDAAAGDASSAGLGAPLTPSANGDALATLWQPSAERTARKTVEDLLVERGQVEAEKVVQARTVQATSRGK